MERHRRLDMGRWSIVPWRCRYLSSAAARTFDEAVAVYNHIPRVYYLSSVVLSLQDGAIPAI